MKNKKHTISIIFLIFPIVVFVLVALILGALTISYFSSGSDPAAMLLIFVGSVCFLVAPLPCLISTIVGTVLAAMAKKEGFAPANKFFVLGIVELVIDALGVIGMIVAAFITILAVIG